MKLSIVVPCYNEEKNIPLILAGFGEVIKRNDVEVLIVDNGSTDGSAILLKNLLSNYPFARIVEIEKNQGYGFGILSGLKKREGNISAGRTGICKRLPQIY